MVEIFRPRLKFLEKCKSSSKQHRFTNAQTSVCIAIIDFFREESVSKTHQMQCC